MFEVYLVGVEYILSHILCQYLFWRIFPWLFRFQDAPSPVRPDPPCHVCIHHQWSSSHWTERNTSPGRTEFGSTEQHFIPVWFPHGSCCFRVSSSIFVFLDAAFSSPRNIGKWSFRGSGTTQSLCLNSLYWSSQFFNRESVQWVYKPLLQAWWPSLTTGNQWEFRPQHICWWKIRWKNHLEVRSQPIVWTTTKATTTATTTTTTTTTHHCHNNNNNNNNHNQRMKRRQRRVPTTKIIPKK